jgi:serine phosphatase RsbU (regulator of sigma subunit)
MRMRLRRGRLPALPPRRTLLTTSLVLGLFAAFCYATYLSYWAGVDISSAFTYQSDVVAAQRDSELLEVEQFDRGSSERLLRPYEKLLASDLDRIGSEAESRVERPPAFTFPARRTDYELLTAKLANLENAGRIRFEQTSRANTHTRDISNALFAIIALLFAVLSSRLRSAVEEGRSLVERLQRAFISKRRAIPNLDLGSVLLSATRGSNVGGDVYDAFTYDNRTAMFFVGDVSGKGIEAAVDTALIKYSLRTLFSLDHDPGTMLRRFAEIYAKSAENAESFIVLFLATIDLVDGTVRYASAGHEPAWAVNGQDVTRLPPTGPIVGVVPNAIYQTRTVQLRFGDALVISTDGVTESRDGRGTLLGADAVTVWLTEIGGEAQKMADAIVRRIRRRSSGITDDLAILVVRFAPGRPGARTSGGARRSRTPA